MGNYALVGNARLFSLALVSLTARASASPLGPTAIRSVSRPMRTNARSLLILCTRLRRAVTIGVDMSPC
jgi:hypothetical protein